MTSDIKVPQELVMGKDLSERIAAHNERVERVWLTKGSNCKPFTPSISTVLGAGIEPSRVPAAERAGFKIEARTHDR